MPRVTAEQRAKVFELTADNKSSREVAEATGLSKTTVGALLRKQRATEQRAVEANDIPLQVEAPPAMNSDTAEHFLADVTAGVLPPAAVPAAIANLPKPADVINEAKFDTLIATLMKDAPTRGRKGAVRHHEPAPSAVQMRETPAPPAPSALAIPPPLDKDALVAKITLNVSSFAPLLKDIVTPDAATFIAGLPKRRVDDLAALLKTIEHTRSAANLTNYGMHMLFMGAGFVEMGTTRWFGMDTRGYQQALQAQSDEIRMIIKELAIEQAGNFQRVQRPEVRLAMIMTSTLLAVNSQNALRAARVPRGNAPESASPAGVTPAKSESYQDL
jgi:hypothetical protein